MSFVSAGSLALVPMWHYDDYKFANIGSPDGIHRINIICIIMKITDTA